MDEEKMESILKAYFTKQKELPEKSPNCPSVESLSRYVSGELEAGELDNISSHFKSCRFCNELIEEAMFYSAYGRQISFDDVPSKVKNRVKSLNPSYKIKNSRILDYLKRGIWPVFFLTSLVMSFFIPRYFLQFLILAVIFGLKWVFNRESTRTLIMIYNAWKKHDKESEKELERIFKSRLTQ